jgi:hypothetical protein
MTQSESSELDPKISGVPRHRSSIKLDESALVQPTLRSCQYNWEASWLSGNLLAITWARVDEIDCMEERYLPAKKQERLQPR